MTKRRANALRGDRDRWASSAQGWLSVVRDALIIGALVAVLAWPDRAQTWMKKAGFTQMSAFGFVVEVRRQANEALVEVGEVERVVALADSARGRIDALLDREATVPSDLRVPLQEAAAAIDSSARAAESVRDSVEVRLVRLDALTAFGPAEP